MITAPPGKARENPLARAWWYIAVAAAWLGRVHQLSVGVHARLA